MTKQMKDITRGNLLLTLYNCEFVSALRLVELLHKCFIFFLARFFFKYSERIPDSEILSQNDTSLFIIMGWCHLCTCLDWDFQVLQNYYFQKLNSESFLGHKVRVGSLLLANANLIFFIGVCFTYPILYYFDFEVVRVDSDTVAWRLILNFLYLLANLMLKSGTLDNMQMLILDGLFLPQIIAIYSYNTVSLALAVFCFTPMLIFQNLKMIFDVILFQRESEKKSSFSRLIGHHDTVYLIVCFSVMIVIFAIFDAIKDGSSQLLMASYLLPMVYFFTWLMDKQTTMVRSLFAHQVILVSVWAVAGYLILKHGAFE